MSNKTIYIKDIFNILKSNNINKLNELINDGKNIYIKDCKGITTLIYACIYSNIDIIDVLLNNNKSHDYINYKDLNQYNALTHACIRGDFEIVKLLLNYGADPYSVNKMKSNILYFSIYNLDILKYFIENYKDLDINLNYNDENGNTFMCKHKNILNLIIKIDKIDVFEYIIKNTNINVNMYYITESSTMNTILTNILKKKCKISDKLKYLEILLSTNKYEIFNKDIYKYMHTIIIHINNIFNILYKMRDNEINVLELIIEYIYKKMEELKASDSFKDMSYTISCVECNMYHLLKNMAINEQYECIEYLKSVINIDKFKNFYDKRSKSDKKIKKEVLDYIYAIKSNTKSAAKR